MKKQPHPQRKFAQTTQILGAVAIMTGASLAHANGTMIPIDVSMAGAIVKSSTTIQLRNVNVPSYGNYKLNLTWDPERLVFVVQSVEPDTLPQFAMLPQTVHITREPNQPDYDSLCSAAFGAMYRMGTWEELKAATGNSSDNMATLVNTLSLTNSSKVAVKYGGNVREPASGAMYFATIATGSALSNSYDLLDSVQSLLRVWPVRYAGSGNLLCTKGNATAPF